MRAPLNSRRPSVAALSREAKLRIGPSTITLTIESRPDETMPLGSVEIDAALPSVAPANWGGDTSGSYAQAHGRMLWSNVFSGKLAVTLGQAARSAASSGEYLTLRVVRDPATPDDRWWQPWELLTDSQGFLALNPSMSVTRGRQEAAPARLLPSHRPLKVDVLVTLPRETFHEIDNEVRWLEDNPQLDVTVLPDSLDRDGVIEKLHETEADVLHVIGTGDDYGNLVVASTSPGDDPPYVDPLYPPTREINVALGNLISISTALSLSPAHVSDAIGGRPTVGLVVLNGCNLHRVAEAVASTGATVLAHRGPVQDPHASALTQALYPALLAGHPTDVSLTEARRSLEESFPGQAGWATTTLFTPWPPVRYTPLPTADPSRLETAPVDVDPSRVISMSADDLVHLMHSTNLAKLQTLELQSWSHIAEQLAAARESVTS